MVLWAAGIKIDKTEFTNILECKDFMRIIYIRFGTGVVRNKIDEHAWYNATNKKNDWELKNEEYIITDPRFPNEYEGNRDIYKMKCFVLKVDREILFQRFMKDFPQSNEEKFQEFYDSETEQLSDFLLKSDENIIVIENNGTFEEFEAKILAEIEKIRNEC
jgi:dephospho-CoA kinase